MKMLKGKIDNRGFTLLESIVTLMLVGITAVLGGMYIVNVANGYVFAKMNADTTQKGQLAMTRLIKEMSLIQSITSSSNTSITFIRSDLNNPSGASVTVSTSGETLLINVNNSGNSVLTDNVSAFNLNYCNDNLTSPTCASSWATGARIIEITLTLSGANNTPSTFTTRVTPRNI